ncbi:MAG: ATP synthase subunit I [Thermodesulfobacteriota bacterium]
MPPEPALFPPVMALALAGLAGFLTGLAYFAGLWRSLKALPGRERPRRSYALALLARLALALAVFWAALTLAGPLGLGLALAGFALARMILSRTLGGQRGRPPRRPEPTATRGATGADQP